MNNLLCEFHFISIFSPKQDYVRLQKGHWSVFCVYFKMTHESIDCVRHNLFLIQWIQVWHLLLFGSSRIIKKYWVWRASFFVFIVIQTLCSTFPFRRSVPWGEITVSDFARLSCVFHKGRWAEEANEGRMLSLSSHWWSMGWYTLCSLIHYVPVF